MTIPGLKPAEWVDERDSSVFDFFKEIELKWHVPEAWNRKSGPPKVPSSDPLLYVLTRNHGRQIDIDRIVYIGITTDPQGRFRNHHKDDLAQMNSGVGFSYANVRLAGRNGDYRTERALHDIEHLLIWSVPECWPYLKNVNKMWTLPKVGLKNENAWRIKNTGYGFSGRMPSEIIYPWMLVKNGRGTHEK